MKAIEMVYEFAKNHQVNTSLNTQGLAVFCLNTSCMDCKIQKLCIQHDNPVIITKSDIAIIKQTNPEWLI